MSVEDKFYAAVKVIKNLPKNGSFQPTHHLMLTFYSLYKQATEGPNLTPKPSFWEVIKKAKWEAWASLGNMPKHRAMEAYVAELNEIVETMAYSDNVADFLSSINSFYTSVPAEEVEMCIGPALEKVRSRNTSPVPDSPNGSPIRLAEPIVDTSMRQDSADFDEMEGSDKDIDDADDEDDFLDTLEQTEPEIRTKHETSLSTARKLSLQTHSLPNGHIPNGKYGSTHTTEVRLNEALHKTVECLRRDLVSLGEKLQRVEDRRKVASRFFGNLSRSTVMFIIGWPIFVHIVLLWLLRRKKKPSPSISF